jgi:hypothetical protein
VGLLAWFLTGAAIIGWHWPSYALVWQSPKLATRAVAIESDDWGGAPFPIPTDERNDKAVDAIQSAAVERVSKVLRRHRDACGRHPCFTAFVVVGRPDVAAIAADPESQYHWHPIDETMPRLVASLNSAQAEGLFSLEYHARDHLDAGLFSEMVGKAAKERHASDRWLAARTYAILHPDSQAESNRIIDEYYDNRVGSFLPLEQSAIDRKVRDGLREFERLFHRSSLCTVAPRSIWGVGAEQVWSKNGIRYVQSVNAQKGNEAGPNEMYFRKFGYRTGTGLIGAPRQVHFECDDEGNFPSIDDLTAIAARTFQSGQPLYISTHSDNYYPISPQKSDASECQLDALLTALERLYPDIRYVASRELGELAETGRITIGNGGAKSEIALAGGITHTRLSVMCLCYTHPKLAIWILGLALFAVALTLSSVGPRFSFFFSSQWRRNHKAKNAFNQPDLPESSEMGASADAFVTAMESIGTNSR